MNNIEIQLNDFIQNFEARVKELASNAHLAYYNASISGKPEDYNYASKLQLDLEKTFADKSDFKLLKEFKKSQKIEEPFLKRQLSLLYNAYAGNQIEETLLEEIIGLSTKIEQKFSTFRAPLESKELTDNEIDKILDESTDNEELEKVWNASKLVGEEVYEDVIKLVKLRNKAAKQLGYTNYHEMSLLLSEQNVEEIKLLFDKLDDLTKSEFSKLKGEMDLYLSRLYKIDKDELMPWNYQDKFFQQGPAIYDLNIDSLFEKNDIEKITNDYFSGINLDINDILEKSDLYEKHGKYQHAYCTNINREGDVRVVCNIKPNSRWMSTMLHEYGHAAYEKFISRKIPWLLREPAHIFTTEAIAMLFGRLIYNPYWLRTQIDAEVNEIKNVVNSGYKALKLEQLIFSRWVQVVFRFERELYSNPDQDLNKLWWTLVEKYQQLKKPQGRNKPDWAAKIHIALYPAYYHNYILGELLASQLHYYICEKVLKVNPNETSFSNDERIGGYLKHLYFSYGSTLHWSDLIKHATGEELSPKYYAKQFVNSQ
ncbi:MAG: M2 family metallopeptidase [Melioribacteraceae bacterium]|nr:M2 family metallopeptidase [Melioribacteraceae bacterium]